MDRYEKLISDVLNEIEKVKAPIISESDHTASWWMSGFGGRILRAFHNNKTLLTLNVKRLLEEYKNETFHY